MYYLDKILLPRPTSIYLGYWVEWRSTGPAHPEQFFASNGKRHCNAPWMHRFGLLMSHVPVEGINWGALWHSWLCDGDPEVEHIILSYGWLKDPCTLRPATWSSPLAFCTVTTAKFVSGRHCRISTNRFGYEENLGMFETKLRSSSIKGVRPCSFAFIDSSFFSPGLSNKKWNEILKQIGCPWSSNGPWNTVETFSMALEHVWT